MPAGQTPGPGPGAGNVSQAFLAGKLHLAVPNDRRGRQLYGPSQAARPGGRDESSCRACGGAQPVPGPDGASAGFSWWQELEPPSSGQRAAGLRPAPARQLDHRLSVLAAGHPAQPSSPGQPAADGTVRPNPEHSEARTATGFPGALSGSACLRPSWPGTAGGVLALRAETPVPWFHRTNGPALVPGRGSSSARLCIC